MKRLRDILTEAGNILVRNVNPDACEAFLRKYPKVRTVMTSIARKNKDLMKGYKAFLKFKDANEGYLGGRAEVTKSPNFGEKTFWKYDWMGATGWAEIYQYIDGTKVESVKEAIKGMLKEIQMKYDFSPKELEKLIQTMKRHNSTEVKMIAAFEKALGKKVSAWDNVNEAGFPEELPFEEFAKKRLEGAAKIAKDARDKGGAAMLTYHHFVVKLPHYKTASEGRFDVEAAKSKLKTHLDELCELGSDMEQIRFQELVGLIEVLGELIIKYK